MRSSLLRSLALVLVVTAWALPCHAAVTGLRAVDAAWVKAMKANDVDAVMRCYAQDAVAWLPDEPMAQGKAAIRDGYERFLSANTVKDVTVLDASYRTAGTMAVAWGRFSLTLEPKSGGDTITMTGRFTAVGERRAGRWVYTVDHASADPTERSEK